MATGGTPKTGPFMPIAAKLGVVARIVELAAEALDTRPESGAGCVVWKSILMVRIHRAPPRI
jgi:hypothetical protein